MIALLSPAKQLDFESPVLSLGLTNPAYSSKTSKLISIIKKMSVGELGSLMKISDALAMLNYERYQQFSAEPGRETTRPAIQAFKGDVYKGLAVEAFSEEDLMFAQSHLRILSGLYGLLRPLDQIQPYRLEMGTKLEVGKYKNLYAFWRETVTKAINESIRQSGSEFLINLASNEYFKAVLPAKVRGSIINIQFKDRKNGVYKTLMLYAKQSRGRMAAYMVQNRISDPEALKEFDREGYQFNSSLSTAKDWVFTRN